MRLTTTDIRTEHYRALNMVDQNGNPLTDVNIDNNFYYHLGQRYQLILAKMVNYKTVKPYTITTANNVQITPFPPGLVTIEGGYITVGSVNFPLTPISSRFRWEQLNSIQIQASALPQFFFVEQDSFQIWPIPQATYTGVIYYHYRDRNLSIPDVSSGVITLTNASNIVANSSAVFTRAMIGRWLTVNDPAVYGQGTWYRITGYTDTTHLTLGTSNGQPMNWTYPTVTPASYRIGETPEIPEEGHVVLGWGTAADYYASIKKDVKSAGFYNRMFYTGDPDNPSKDFDDRKVVGGLIGMINSYRDRDSRVIIRKKQALTKPAYKVFGVTLSG